VCDSFGGTTNAVLTAKGGDASYTGGYHPSSGGGGRIAVWYGVPSATKALLLTDPDNAGALAPNVLITDSYGNFSTNTNIRVEGGDVLGSDPTVEEGDPGTVVFLTVPPPSGNLILVW
jgi:hypothetical protein